jgi:hypothetical protein
VHERMLAYRTFTSVLGDDFSFQDFIVTIQHLPTWQKQVHPLTLDVYTVYKLYVYIFLDIQFIFFLNKHMHLAYLS